MKRWWRRNRWGLAVLLPALVAAVGFDARDAYRHNRNAQPCEPIGAGADGWVDFDGARMRLAEISRGELREYGGRPFVPPASLRVWRAEIVFAGAAGAALGGCRLLLEDDAGRTFDASPAELRGLRVPLSGCAPPTSPTGPPPGTTYTTIAHFVTPAGARPVAVRVTLHGKLPRYARLTGG